MILPNIVGGLSLLKAEKMIHDILLDTLTSAEEKNITTETILSRTRMIMYILVTTRDCPLTVSQSALLESANNLEEFWFHLCGMFLSAENDNPGSQNEINFFMPPNTTNEAITERLFNKFCEERRKSHYPPLFFLPLT